MVNLQIHTSILAAVNSARQENEWDEEYVVKLLETLDRLRIISFEILTEVGPDALKEVLYYLRKCIIIEWFACDIHKNYLENR